jgi:ketol-acid reductoisomerase
MLLIPDEVLPAVSEDQIKPNLIPKTTLVFASGDNVAFEQIELPKDSDILLLAPRMIGVGVRERYLKQEGCFCFVGVHQDSS